MRGTLFILTFCVLSILVETVAPNSTGKDTDETIIIVGGGWAGLGAAIELRKSNKSFLLIEARNRIGGRSFTSDIFHDGMKLDLGSSWVHGTINNPIMEFVNEFSLPIS